MSIKGDVRPTSVHRSPLKTTGLANSIQRTSSVMNVSRFTKNSTWLLFGGVLASIVCCSGCQTNVGGQTLPSAYYLRDDVQYFPSGPEFKLSRTVQAMEEYKAAGAELDAD